MLIIINVIIGLGINYYIQKKRWKEINKPAERIKYIYDGNGKIVHEFKYDKNGQLIRE